MIKGAKSIAEYAIRRWLLNQCFDMNYFKIFMNGNEAEIEDRDGNTMTLVYDDEYKDVYVK